MPGQLHGLGGWRRNRPCPPNALATEKPRALAFRAGGLDCPPLRCLAGLKSAAGIGPERPVLASLSNLASSGLKTRLRKRPRAGALPTGGEFGGRRAGSRQRRERGGCSLLCEAARGVTRPSNGMLTLRVRRALAARFGLPESPLSDSNSLARTPCLHGRLSCTASGRGILIIRGAIRGCERKLHASVGSPADAMQRRVKLQQQRAEALGRIPSRR
jgi:hypothetical protein